ncbi:hypothetical protein ACEVJL_09935 [Pseudoflavonifractor sp. P01025]|uniref:hypothetical protein n=1 Tax=Flintibacter porci TaxID=3342383 RepID=UPI0035B69FB6
MQAEQRIIIKIITKIAAKSNDLDQFLSNQSQFPTKKAATTNKQEISALPHGSNENKEFEKIIINLYR